VRQDTVLDVIVGTEVRAMQLVEERAHTIVVLCTGNMRIGGKSRSHLRVASVLWRINNLSSEAGGFSAAFTINIS
jgi:hypothetical protein